MSSASSTLKRLRDGDATLREVVFDPKECMLGRLLQDLIIYPNSVTRLEVHKKSIDEHEWAYLAAFLAISTTIEELDIASSYVSTSMSMRMVVSALRVNKSLRHLEMFNAPVLDDPKAVQRAMGAVMAVQPARAKKFRWDFDGSSRKGSVIAEVHAPIYLLRHDPTD